MLFVETHYTLATEEAERIGVDHVARLSNTGTVDASTGMFLCILLVTMADKQIWCFLGNMGYFLWGDSIFLLNVVNLCMSFSEQCPSIF